MSKRTKVPKVPKAVAQTTLEVLSHLLQNYAQNAKLTPLEFIENKLASNKISDEVGSMFLCLYRHKVFLGNIRDIFNEYLIASSKIDKQRRIDSHNSIVFLFLVIFELTPENWNTVYQNFEKNLEMLHWIIAFLSDEECLIKIIEEGCKIYDKDYILERVLGRIIRNGATIRSMSNMTLEEVEKKRAEGRKQLTIPQGPSLLQRKKVSIESAKKPTPKPFESTPVPKSTYEPTDLEKLLEKARIQNRRDAYELLAEANRLNLHCAKPKSPVKPPTPIMYKPIVAKPPPKFDPVVVKGTTASLMRQAALLAKEKETEIREIEGIVNGSYDPANTVLLEEIRQAKEEESLQDIERKHLQGLLTREEAILAKQRLFQRNQAKKQQYQEERIILLDTIDKYRREEEEKTRQLVEKAQAIEKGAKDAEAKLLKERRCNAKLVEYETQILLKQAYEEREEELNKRIQLIKELKLLQQISARHNKVEFDPTETSNLGLWTEMSIAELQERLALLKVTMREELEDRKAKIIAEKRKQQEMLEQMKEFVESAKGQKCKPDVPKQGKRHGKKTTQVPEDIKILRQKLKLAREERANGSLLQL